MNCLIGIELFKDIPKATLEAASKDFEERTYRKGEHLYLEGDPSQFMWFVKSGRVQAAKTLPTGQSLMVCRVEEGEMFGMCCDFGGKLYQCQATAATEVTVVKIPIRKFMTLLERQPSVSRHLMESLAKRLSTAQDMRSLAQEPVEKRIATMLIALQIEHGVSLPFTRREIAEMVGTTVETSIRVLSGFEKQGMINSTRGKIAIQDLHRLQALVEPA